MTTIPKIELTATLDDETVLRVVLGPLDLDRLDRSLEVAAAQLAMSVKQHYGRSITNAEYTLGAAAVFKHIAEDLMLTGNGKLTPDRKPDAPQV